MMEVHDGWDVGFVGDWNLMSLLYWGVTCKSFIILKYCKLHTPSEIIISLDFERSVAHPLDNLN